MASMSDSAETTQGKELRGIHWTWHWGHQTMAENRGWEWIPEPGESGPRRQESGHPLASSFPPQMKGEQRVPSEEWQEVKEGLFSSE